MTFTFSEAPASFDASDITPVGGTISGFTATANPLVYTAIFTATDGFSGTGSVTVGTACRTPPATPAWAAPTMSASTRLNPTLAINIVDPALSDSDNSSVVTFTFSEAPVDFTASRHYADGRHDHRLDRHWLDPLGHYTATFTATDGFTGTGSVSVAAGSYTDAARNARRARLRQCHDRHAEPDGDSQHCRHPLSDSDNSSVVTFVFSELPVGFTACDINASNGLTI